MVCIYCGNKTEVKNSRLKHRSNRVWRRRECSACGSVFTTWEQAALSEYLVKRDGGPLEAFSRDNLFLTVYESCKHRQNALNEADALTQTIINQLIQTQRHGVIERDTIVHYTHMALSRFDPVAGSFYAAYHV